MKRISTCLSMLAMLVTSCVVNDLPYPLVVPSISSIEVEDALSVNVDSDKRTVSVVLDEQADLARVRVKSATYSEEITVSEPEIVAVHDLTAPLRFTLKTYQDYSWTLSATRPVERWFNVSGQVGSSIIDDVNRRAVAYVQMNVDLSKVEVTALKLGPRDITTLVPEMSQMHDFTGGVEVKVNWSGKSETWHLYVEQTATVVEMKSVSPWTRVAWLSASGVAERQNGFRFRRKGSQDWTEAKDVKSEGGDFSCCIEGLDPETAYECIAYSGDDVTSVEEFVTDPEQQLPNAGFESFSHAESANYFSWFDPASAFPTTQTKWWDSGNIGSTTVGSSYAIAVPDAADRKEGNASACLISRNVIIKFAAGNTFSGEFVGLIGTQGGIINFGRPFGLRPRAMKLWMKYECGVVDCIGTVPDGENVKNGDADRCQLWVAVGDWDYHKYGGTSQCPVQVNTTDKSTLFRPDTEAVIGYGALISNKSTDGWVEVEIPIEYNSVTRKPTHIIVSFASSLLGDYFTGSSTSKLWVDDIRLIY